MIFMSLFRQLPFPVSLASFPNGAFVEVSDAWVQFFGIPRSDAVGKNSVDLGLKLSPTWHETVFAELQKFRVSHCKEFEFATQNGVVRYCVADMDLVKIGEQEYIHTVIQDITDRKQYEQALINSELKAKAILDASPVPLAIFDSEGNINYLNRSFVSLFGYSPEEIPTQNDWLLRAYPEEDYRKWVVEQGRGSYRDAISTGEPFKAVEVNICCKDSSVKTIIFGAEILRVDNKQSLLASFFDVTQLKTATDALHKSETFLRLSQNVGGIGSWEADLISNRQQWSDNCIALLDFPQIDNPTWEDFLALVHPDDRQLVVDATQAHLDHGTEYDVEFRAINSSDEIRWMRSRGQAERDENGKPIIMRGITQDVTQQRKAREDLRLSEDRYRKAFETSIDAININRMSDGMYIHVNQAFVDILGYQRNELIGHSSLELNIWAEPSDRTRLIESLQQHSICRNLEARFRCKSGQIIWGLMSASIIDIDGVECILSTTRDITELKRNEEAVQSVKVKLEAALANMTDAVYISDSDGNFIDFNVAFATFHKFKNKDECPKALAEFPKLIDVYCNGEFVPLEDRPVARALRGESSIGAEYTLKRHDTGETWDGNYTYAPIRDNNGEIVGSVVTARDVTALKKAESELRISAIAFETQEGVLITDAQSMILRVNTAFTRITGYSADEVVGKTPRILSSGRQDAAFYEDMWESITRLGSWEGEIWNKRKNNEVYPEHLRITAVKNHEGIVKNYVATLTDITMSRDAAEEIQHLAFYDTLTGLPNRRLLLDRLKLALASSARTGKEGALLFLDLDNFKILNDTLGHDIGDLLLKQVARRIESSVREGDTVARLGGDEFVVMLEGLSDQTQEAAAQTESVGSKILAVLNHPYELASHEYKCTASIGVTLFRSHDTVLDELFKQADIAMYQAKKAGRNALRFYDPEMQSVINARVTLENDLHKAIEQQQFQLYYQVQVDSSRLPLGAEALIRWLHPEQGIVSPANFIPLAEETGLIIPIGLWVLDTACAQLKAWQLNTLTQDLTLSVNVSAKQFHEPTFVAEVQDAIKRHSIDPTMLKLEPTESILLENIDEAVATMNALKAFGVRFALDDFGTGFSSLQYLKKLPLNQLKIDQSFVRDLVLDANDQAIVRTIIAMAQSLNLEVIAEGVETEQQQLLLQGNGCNHYQGYLFGKPVPIEEFEADLARLTVRLPDR